MVKIYKKSRLLGFGRRPPSPGLANYVIFGRFLVRNCDNVNFCKLNDSEQNSNVPKYDNNYGEEEGEGRTRSYFDHL